MRQVTFKIIVFLAAFFTAAVVVSCRFSGGGGGDTPAAFTADPASEEIIPSQGYLDRKAQYLAHCADKAPTGGMHSQVCAAYNATGAFSESEIRNKLNKVNTRTDCSDFEMNSIIRVLYFDRRSPSLPGALRDDMKWAVLNFKYWLDEPGPDDMVWWSENHQILFHTAEYTAGLLYPDEVFPNSGMTGREHVEHAIPLIETWLEHRARFGFAEWHSNPYFVYTLSPLVNLVDFAEDENIRTRAAMLIDTLAFDMLSNHYKGLYATTNGRTYPGRLVGGLSYSTREGVYLLTGLAEPAQITDLGHSDMIADYLATSDKYYPPAILEAVANDSKLFMEHRQRDSIDTADGPSLGISYTDFNDVMFWWGMTGYASPYVIDGSLAMVEHYNMWEGSTWSDLESFLRPLVGDPMVNQIIDAMWPVSQGVMLETVNTYTYRTPYYQISAAQDWKPGSITGQCLMWLATIDKDSYVFTTFPSNEGNTPLGENTLGSLWTGGFVPRATVYKNVGVFQYRETVLDDLSTIMPPGIDWGPLLLDYTHAYFPKDTFDQVVETGNWTIGKKGDSYVALYSQVTPQWSSTLSYELVADSKNNAWIIEMGDAENNGAFPEFVQSIEDAFVYVSDKVYYDSPSQGFVKVGWTGPMVVAGNEVDLGPYGRWDNPYCKQEFDTPAAAIEFQGRRLEHDFEAPSRTYSGDPLSDIEAPSFP